MLHTTTVALYLLPSENENLPRPFGPDFFTQLSLEQDLCPAVTWKKYKHYKAKLLVHQNPKIAKRI